MNQTKQDKIWTHYQNYQSEVFKNSRSRLQYILVLIRDKFKGRETMKILNIGVGDGFFEKEAKKKGWDVYSLDPDEKSINNLKQNVLDDERARIGYMQAIPLADNFFDAVVVSEVFEHLSSEVLSQGLAEISRVLKPGGYLIGTVPARENLSDLIVFCPRCCQAFHRWGHVQSFAINDLKRILSKYFYLSKIYEKYFINRELNWKGRWNGYLKLFLELIGVHGSGQNIIFIGISKK